ncbi:hypothetical protein Y032_0465g1944 [Ancylostoma ceylanicum]|uniref:Uncharacterized protein n=1 Tax=Ancylostoma ceylanicum TaxID=53326 RepID=A0A016WYF3_9BILA|nr:hypothetical protein Y032_0465g1944 [Ancylostoma ceylanicum]
MTPEGTNRARLLKKRAREKTDEPSNRKATLVDRPTGDGSSPPVRTVQKYLYFCVEDQDHSHDFGVFQPPRFCSCDIVH